MKTLYLILLLFTNCLLAQELPVLSTTSLANPDHNNSIFCNDGNYAQDTANEREQYVGTWEYREKNVLFQLKIEKGDKHLTKWENNGKVSRYNYSDVVFFKYKLIVKGNVIFDNLNQDIYFQEDVYPLATKMGSHEDLGGIFIDVTKNIGSTLTIKRLNTAPAKIIFNLSSINSFPLKPGQDYNPDHPDFTVPTGEIEMIKIN